QPLAAFSHDGPFATLAMPNDVTVTRQVLAEPDSGLSERTWATLVDGTPLVTATRRGKGVLVLFHVTADTRWSNLPLSGTFVDMLRHIVELAGSSAAAEAGVTGPRAQRDVVPPSRVLDGFGAFGPPPASARPVPSNFTARATGDHPPGFYGPPEALLAVNTLSPSDRPEPIDFAPLNARREAYRLGEPPDLRAPLFLAALALLVLDALVVFSLAGGIRRVLPRPRIATVVLIAAGLSLAPPGAPRAGPADDQVAMKSTTDTRLAYVITGDAEVDNLSKAGLQGLTMFLAQRTALEAGEALGVHHRRGQVALYSPLFCPLLAAGAAPPAPAPA